jgi:hypothetical protein
MADFYAEPEVDLRQGDIIFPVVFPLLQLKQDGQPVNTTIDLGQLATLRTCTLSVVSEVSWGMIITQTCDLTERSVDNILVARIFKAAEKFKDFPTEERALRNKVDLFKNAGKQPKYFFLPKFEKIRMDTSVVYLLETQPFSYKNREALKQRRQTSLSSVARAAVQERLAYMFGRVALPDDFYLNSP